MTIQIIPFTKDHLRDAAKLLAKRHQRERRLLPELPQRFEEPAAAEDAINAALQRYHAEGYVAMDDDCLIAYLVGDRVIDSVRGRSGWVRLPGCAYDPRAGVETVRDLYAMLGEQWVNDGIFSHVALMPLSDPNLLQAWYSLAFGIEQIHALLDLTTVDQVRTEVPENIRIRQVRSDDQAHLAAMSDIIWRTQVQAPVWAAMMPETVGELSEGWAGLAKDEESIAWLAMRGEEPLGVQVYWPAEATDENMLIAERSIHLGVAGTRAPFRGQGIATALTSRGLRHAADAGFTTCETDWRSTNLFSSRFWPRRGFRPAAYRLARRIDRRIAWATGIG